jgi:hypothetical protein
LEINIEKLIEIIVREVIKELLKHGELPDFFISEPMHGSSGRNRIKKKDPTVIDMSNYKTPLLTEEQLKCLDPGITEITVPIGTIITPGAKDIIKKRNLILNNI